MKLAELIMKEAGVAPEAIMFLRHGSELVATLLRFGSTIDQLTDVQPIESKYDYFHPSRPRIEIVVVIVHDQVDGVYRVAGVKAEGTNYSLTSEAHQRFDSARNVPEAPHRYFLLQPLPSVAVGLAVCGWEGRTRTPVQRSSDSFFWDVEVVPQGNTGLREAIEQSFATRIAASAGQSQQARLARLASAPKQPTRVEVSAWVFSRNPDVVAEVLHRASGYCEACANTAPFIRKSDGTPYLEVHHRTPLASGGDDTVDNAVALCPNCHRRAHYA